MGFLVLAGGFTLGAVGHMLEHMRAYGVLMGDEGARGQQKRTAADDIIATQPKGKAFPPTGGVIGAVMRTGGGDDGAHRRMMSGMGEHNKAMPLKEDNAACVMCG